MECNFRVGQKVVCVKKGEWQHVTGPGHGAPDPQFGEVVTVAEIVPFAGTIGVSLAEYHPFVLYGYDRFRPIHETQINELRQIAIDAFKSKKVTAVSETYQPGVVR